MMSRAEAERVYSSPALFLAGDLAAAGGRPTFEVHDPATGNLLAAFPAATDRDIETALLAAERGFGTWSRLDVTERSAILLRVADLVLANRQRLAALVTLELGKPYGEALAEADTAAAMFRWAGEEARRLYGRQIPAREVDGWQVSFVEPVGIVAAFAAWNAPLITPARKISGALAAGCSVILKAAEKTPACAVELARLVAQAGAPEGCLSVLFGDRAMISERLLSSPAVRAMTFTGSTPIGRQMSVLAAKTLKKQVLELGGNAPVLVFADMDVAALARAAAAAKFRNAGQVCTSPTRFIVERAAYEPFAAALAENARGLRVGDGFDAGTQMGPLAHPGRVEAMASLIQDARQRGLRILAGGERMAGPGCFHQPTVVADADTGARLSNEEAFGPIAVLTPFDRVAEAVSLANRLSVGLAAYVMTNRLDVARAAARQIEAGTVSINNWRASLPETPFGGVKDSGFGREGGSEGILAFTTIKHVSVM